MYMYMYMYTENIYMGLLDGVACFMVVIFNEEMENSRDIRLQFQQIRRYQITYREFGIHVACLCPQVRSPVKHAAHWELNLWGVAGNFSP